MSVRSKIEWVRCSDRMPEPDGPEVLVWDGYEYFVAKLLMLEEGPSDREKPFWRTPGDEFYAYPESEWWAPLPEPPGGERL